MARPGRSPTPISDAEEARIAAALAAGTPLKVLYNSGRFKGVSEKAMRRIARERGVNRKRSEWLLPMADGE
jgi:hypothetical protein